MLGIFARTQSAACSAFLAALYLRLLEAGGARPLAVEEIAHLRAIDSPTAIELSKTLLLLEDTRQSFEAMKL